MGFCSTARRAAFNQKDESPGGVSGAFACRTISMNLCQKPCKLRLSIGDQMTANASALTEKIQSLNADQIAEVEDFVEFVRLRGQERSLTRAAAAVSGPAFETIWNNPEDAAYDAL